MNLVGYFFDVHIFLIYCFLVCGLSLCLIETFSEHTFSPLIQPTLHLFLYMDCVFRVVKFTNSSSLMLSVLTDVS